MYNVTDKRRDNIEVASPDLNLSIYLYTYKTLIILIVWLIDCLLEAVCTNPGYGMAALIYKNLLNLILGRVMLLRSS